MNDSRLGAESDKPIRVTELNCLNEESNVSSAEERHDQIPNGHNRDRGTIFPSSSIAINISNSNADPCNPIGIPQILEVKGYFEDASSQENDVEISHEIMVDDSASNGSHIDDTNSISIDYDASVTSESNVVDNGQNHYTMSICNDTWEHVNWNLLGAVSLSIFSFLSIALIPYHNVILHPYYWYESIFPGITGFAPWFVGVVSLQITRVLQFEKIRSPSVIFQLGIAMSISFAISHSFVHLSWSYYLGYEFPKHLRSDSTFRDRIIAYFCFELWCILVPFFNPSINAVSTHTLFKEISSMVWCNFTSCIEEDKWTFNEQVHPESR